MSRLHQNLMLIILSVLSMWSISSSFALANSTKPAPSSEVQLKHSNTAAYLGISVDLLSKELTAQLPEDILIGQGIMVSGFAKDSTAQKQGVKLYDILLAYDQHAIMHPSKFIRLIKSDKPKRIVKLMISRQGKIISVPVTLGSQQYPLDEDQLDYQYNMQVNGFDGMKIKQFSEDDFQAAIRYLDLDGIVRSRTFSGQYNKIQHEIQAATDISKVAKQHLMIALSKRKKDEEGWFGEWIPFNDGNFSPDAFKNFGL